MKHPAGLNEPGKRVLLTGNEALARGALEAGVQVASSYPGTPASEILETLATVAKNYNFHAEWAVNEKVAFETALGAAYTGVRSLVSMKNVGLNVMMDPLMSANQTGVKGGMVVIVADDPSGHSSQNEQDSRILAKFAELPMLEPSTPQEGKDVVKEAFDLSEELELIVMVRSMTRLSHSRGDVVLGPINLDRTQAKFEKDLMRWAMFAAWSHHRHKWLHDQQPKVKKLTERMSINKLRIPKDPRLAIVAGGLCNTYVDEALQILHLTNKVATLKIGTPHPLPERKIKKLMKSSDTILVAEEVEPFLEEQLRAITYELDEKPTILGKLTGHLPREFEFNTDILTSSIADIMGVQYQVRTPHTEKILKTVRDKIIIRPLTMCPGCPHRASFYSIRQAVKKVSKGKAAYCGDIGCLTLGVYKPLSVQDTVTCMGASISVGAGMAQAGLNEPVIALIGDSTLIHSGITPIISANWNKAKLLITILDNRSTAMTGFQPHPGLDRNAMGDPTNPVSIEDIVKASNIDFVRTLDPYNVEEAERIYTEALKYDKTAVVISKHECALIGQRKARKAGTTEPPYAVDHDACIHCKICMSQFGCPAIYSENKKSNIDPILCIGCGVCEAVCPHGAIYQLKEDA